MEFAFCPYRRRFRHPLQTSHGQWSERQGILLRLRDEAGRTGYGEIAPLPWFGSETQRQALVFCHRFSTRLKTWHAATGHLDPTSLDLAALDLPPELPATAFGLGSAIAQLQQAQHPDPGQNLDQFPPPAQVCALLPTGEQALTAWPALWQRGHRSFKWKIAVADLATEQRQCQQLLTALPPDATLRLDANGGLTPAEAERWLAFCDALAPVPSVPAPSRSAQSRSAQSRSAQSRSIQARLEFIEQPLPPQQFSQLCQLAQGYRTPLALDESVANLAQLQACYHRGWRGIVVIKGAIAGPPQDLLNFCLTHHLDVVFSSVFETGIGRRALVQLAQDYQRRSPHPPRPLGLGTDHWLAADGLTADTDAAIWQRVWSLHPIQPR